MLSSLGKIAQCVVPCAGLSSGDSFDGVGTAQQCAKYYVVTDSLFALARPFCTAVLRPLRNTFSSRGVKMNAMCALHKAQDTNSPFAIGE